MSNSINQELDRLFNDWKPFCNYFVKDGIMLKPNRQIDVDEAWINSERRIAFLLKDQNQSAGNGQHWDDDTRLWLTTDNQLPKGQLFQIIANLFYGLWHIDTDEYNQVWFGELKQDKVVKLFNEYPFAFIECKKEPGDQNLKDSVLRHYLQEKPHADFLSKELEILNPNIIVCCGGPIFDFCINLYGKDNLHNYGQSGNLKFSKKNNTIIIYCEHPAKPGTNKQRFHDVTLDLFREFVKSEDGYYFLQTIKEGSK